MRRPLTRRLRIRKKNIGAQQTNARRPANGDETMRIVRELIVRREATGSAAHLRQVRELLAEVSVIALNPDREFRVSHLLANDAVATRVLMSERAPTLILSGKLLTARIVKPTSGITSGRRRLDDTVDFELVSEKASPRLRRTVIYAARLRLERRAGRPDRLADAVAEEIPITSFIAWNRAAVVEQADRFSLRVRGFSDLSEIVLASRNLREPPAPPAMLQLSRDVGTVGKFNVSVLWAGTRPPEIGELYEIAADDYEDD